MKYFNEKIRYYLSCGVYIVEFDIGAVNPFWTRHFFYKTTELFPISKASKDDLYVSTTHYTYTKTFFCFNATEEDELIKLITRWEDQKALREL